MSTTEHLHLVHSLYTDFDVALGQRTAPNENLSRAYHPVLERAKIQNGLTTPELAEGLKNEIRKNIITALAEHFKVKGASGRMIFKDGTLWSPDFPNEPFINVIKRGVAHREKMGSTDLERERAEVEGFEKIINFLNDSPTGTKFISLSPPSQTGGPYCESYVDEFIKISAVEIIRRRTLVNFFLDDYKVFAKIKSHENPSDAWFLKNPYQSGQTVPEERIVGYSPEKFEQIIFSVKSLIDAHLGSLYEQPINWRKTAATLNALYFQAETAKQDLEKFGITKRISFTPSLYQAPVVELRQGGCGTTGGFSFGIEVFLSNSASQWAIKETWDYHRGDCVNCKTKDTYVGPCSICKKCEKILA